MVHGFRTAELEVVHPHGLVLSILESNITSSSVN